MNFIKIDLERIVSDIDRNIFGGYLENLVYGGIYYPESPHADKDGLRTDVLSALERWKLTNMRFPGGNFASNYHWKDAIGLLEDRPVTHNLAWNTIVSNRFGTDEFIRFCRKMNIAPYICANCGDGDMRAADWVEYCNGTDNTSLVKMRQKNGAVEPYRVKFWGIGNEVDGQWQIGYKTPQEYARAAAEFGKVMKRVDQNIKLVASAVSLWEDHPSSPMFEVQSSEWVERTQLMVEQAGDYLDYLAIHRYANVGFNDPLENYMAFAADLDARLTSYEGLIRSISLEKGIKHQISIAVDEYGVMRLPHVGRFDKMVVNMEDALMTGLYLNAFIRHGRFVRLANFTPTLTALGVRSANPDDPLILETLFYPFELYSRTCGQLALDVFWYGDTFSGNYLGRKYAGIRTLDVTATLDASHRQLVIYAVNQSEKGAMDATVTLASGQFTGNVKVAVINGPDIKSENTYDKPDQVITRETTLKASGKSLTLTFEPHSVTALVCAVS